MTNSGESASSPLPFRGGAGGEGSPADAALEGSPHPNLSPEGEGLDSSNSAQTGLNGQSDPAFARFAALQLVRLSGAVLVLAGVMLIAGQVSWLPRAPVTGYLFIAAGLVDFFALPPLLARRWKSKP